MDQVLPGHGATSNLLDERMRFVAIDAQTRAGLADLRPIVVAALPAVLDGFYAHLQVWPQMAAMFGAGKTMARAKAAQTTHWHALFSGRFDAEFEQSARRVGRVHATIGLEPRWYIGGYSHVLTRLTDAVIHATTSRLHPNPTRTAAKRSGVTADRVLHAGATQAEVTHQLRAEAVAFMREIRAA